MLPAASLTHARRWTLGFQRGRNLDLVRPIATATLPCLAAKKRKKKAKSPLAGMSTREKIEYYKKLEAGELPAVDKDKLELAPTIKPGPLVCYTNEEGSCLLRKLFVELQESIDEKIQNDVTKKRVKKNLLLIEERRYTSYEYAAAVRSISEKKKDPRLTKLIQMTGDKLYLTATNVLELIDEEVAKLPTELQNELRQALLDDIEKNDGLSLDPSKSRKEDAILRDMFILDRKEYTKQKRDLMFQMESRKVAYCVGTSMLPTLATRCYVNQTLLVLAKGTPEITANDLKVDDIVTAVVSTPHRSLGWKTDFVAKRIKGLEGDVVRDAKDNAMIVPAGHCWLVGDNLKVSYDSRHYGAVPLSNLRARVDSEIPLEEIDPPTKTSFSQTEIRLFTFLAGVALCGDLAAHLLGV